MRKILFFITGYFISFSVFANTGGDCIEFVGVNGKKYCYSSESLLVRNAVSYCHAQGYNLATINGLCDISSADADRLTRVKYGCKNIVGANIPGSGYLITRTGGPTQFKAILAKTVETTVISPGWNNIYAVCDTGEYGCPQTQPDNPATITTQQCCEYYKDANGSSVFSWDVATNTCRSRCYTTNNANADSGDTTGCQANSDCCSSGDFCAFITNATDTEPGKGTCKPVLDYPKEKQFYGGRIYYRGTPHSAANMNWWSAQNWCTAQSGFVPVTISSLGCSGSGACTSDIVTSLHDGGWNSDKYWLDRVNDGTLAYVMHWETNSIMTKNANPYSTFLSNDVDRFALCVRDATCASGQYFNETSFTCQDCGTNPGNPAQVSNQTCCELFGYVWYTDTCICPDGTRWDETQAACIEACYTTNNENAPENDEIGCTKNSDCCSSNDFCAFLNSDVNTNTKGPGTCIPINTYTPQSITVDDAMFVRSDGAPSAGMNWWSAQNWCMAKGLDPATRDNIGCGSINKDKTTCNSKYTSAWSSDATWMGDNPDRKLWLDDSGSVGWTVRLSKTVNNTSTGQYHNKLSRSDDRFALCRGEPPQCDAVQPEDPSTITTQQCCEYYKDGNNKNIFSWNETTQKCEKSSPFCIYEFQAMEQGAYKADCKYTVTRTNSGVTLAKDNTLKCAADEYCSLGWKTNDCSSGIQSKEPALNTPTVLYGRCNKFTANYMKCHTENELARADMTPIVRCDEGKYCQFQWVDDQCSSGIPGRGVADKVQLYGLCIPSTDNSVQTCPIGG